jgi:hypothetical protein
VILCVEKPITYSFKELSTSLKHRTAIEVATQEKGRNHDTKNFSSTKRRYRFITTPKLKKKKEQTYRNFQKVFTFLRFFYQSEREKGGENVIKDILYGISKRAEKKSQYQ